MDNTKEQQAALAFIDINRGQATYYRNSPFGMSWRGAIVTRIHPRSMRFPEGWRYVAGVMKNNCPDEARIEIPMYQSNGQPWN